MHACINLPLQIVPIGEQPRDDFSDSEWFDAQLPPDATSQKKGVFFKKTPLSSEGREPEVHWKMILGTRSSPVKSFYPNSRKMSSFCPKRALLSPISLCSIRELLTEQR